MSLTQIWRYLVVLAAAAAWCTWLWRVMLRPVVRPRATDKLRWYDRALRAVFAVVMTAFLAYAVPHWLRMAR